MRKKWARSVDGLLERSSRHRKLFLKDASKQSHGFGAGHQLAECLGSIQHIARILAGCFHHGS